MSEKKEKTIQITVKVHPNTYESLKKLAAKNHRTVAEIVRKYLNKGMEIDGYTQDIDFIAGIVRQEIKAQMTPQIERLVKILMKSGKISAALYYLTLKLYVDMVSSDRVVSLKEMATETRKLGIKYMQYKDHEINQYLEDDEMIFKDIERL